MVENKQRVVVLGYDGATFELIKPWINKGELPAFASLLAEGAHGEMASTTPPISAPAWTSFSTGKNPGKHGIFGFTCKKRNGYGLQLMTGMNCRARTFWEIAGSKGLRVIVINVPMTFPPRPVNGILVCGLDAPGIGSQFTYPPDVREEILREFPNYQISMHLGGTLESEQKRIDALEEILASIEDRAGATKFLAQKNPWDILVVKFNNPDIVQHHYWRFMDKDHPQYNASESKRLRHAILHVYKKLDEVLAEFIYFCNKENASLVLMSDHGAGPRIPKSIYLNEWLKSIGMLTPSNNKGRSLGKIFLNRTVRLLLKYVPPSQKDLFRRLSPGAITRMISYFKFDGINWSRTKAYVGEFPSIRMNVAGREKLGTIKPEEYENIRSKIIEGLHTLRDPDTGEMLIERAVRREDVYAGLYVEDAPDIIVEPKDHQYAVSWKFFKRNQASFLVDEPHWRGTSGRHKPNGIVIMKGKPFARNKEVEGANIIDVAPTILYLLGIPIPDDMDGKVLKEMFAEEFLEANTVKYSDYVNDIPEEDRGEIYSPEEAKRIKDMLQSLGYIETEEDR